METINITPVSTENISIEKFMELKKEGKLKNFKIRGIIPPSIAAKGKGRFGSIQVESLNPVYKAL